MNEYCGLLMQFVKKNPCRKHLLKNYPPSLIDSAIGNGYIVEDRKNDLNDPVYKITKKGKQKRDN